MCEENNRCNKISSILYVLRVESLISILWDFKCRTGVLPCAHVLWVEVHFE